MLRLFTTAILVGTVLVFAGCDGGPGPEGPPGRDGQANVYSFNFVFSMADAFVNGAVASIQLEDVEELTPAVVDDGAVLLYYREQGTWTALPYTFGVESRDLEAVDYTISMGYGYDDFFLEVFYEASTEEIDLTLQPDRTMKAVVIEGAVYGKNAVDHSDWEAVKSYYGLSD